MGIRFDQYTAATNAIFRGIVQASVTQAAVDILNDPLRTEQVKSLARTILQGDHAGANMFINQFVWQVALNPTIISTSKSGYDKISDTDVDFVVNSVWPLVAGEGEKER